MKTLEERKKEYRRLFTKGKYVLCANGLSDGGESFMTICINPEDFEATNIEELQREIEEKMVSLLHMFHDIALSKKNESELKLIQKYYDI